VAFAVRLGVITYDAPHLKTEQVVLGLLARGYRFDLWAIPFQARPARQTLIQHRPAMDDAPHPEALAQHYALAFDRVADSRHLPTGYDVLLIAGAGLLPAEVVTKVRTINCHPGLAPAVRGLDAFKWAIYDGQPLGVTLHQVDVEVDRGMPLALLRTPVFPDDSLERLARRHYQAEIGLLVDFERWSSRPMAPDATLTGRPARLRMPLAIEREVLERFDAYKANHAIS